MPIKVPTTASGPLQSVTPVAGGFDGAPKALTSTSITTTNVATEEAVYVMSTVNCHIRFSNVDATVNDAPLPAFMPMVFGCTRGSKVSAIKATGASDGLIYIHNVEGV